MTSLTTAKMLLFIALCIHPDSHSFFITSNNDNYRFTDDHIEGWSVSTRGARASDWQKQGHLLNIAPSGHDAAVIGDYPWSENSALQLSDGNRIEKQGSACFYIINPGAPNEVDYNISSFANP